MTGFRRSAGASGHGAAARPRLRVEAVEAERVVLDRQDREAAKPGLTRDRFEGGGPQDVPVPTEGSSARPLARHATTL